MEVVDEFRSIEQLVETRTKDRVNLGVRAFLADEP
jgi:hypothetical protein